MKRKTSRFSILFGIVIFLFFLQQFHNVIFNNYKILSTKSEKSNNSLNDAVCSESDRATQADILNATARWHDRSDWTFGYNGYNGPWIEERFLEYWRDITHGGCPVGGRFFIPINYNMCHRHCTPEELQALEDYLLRIIDRKLKYFTILLLDKGFFVLGITVPIYLDIVIFASGDFTKGSTFTNVPIPLLKEELVLEEPIPKRTRFVTFAGSLATHALRPELVELHQDKFEFLGTVENWKEVLKESIFCLCPRGYGATSFRMFEAIQLGCIPVYIWDEILMLPFSEHIDWNSFAVIVERKDLPKLPERIKNADVGRLQAGLKKAAPMMTYQYTFDYIMEYLTNPKNQH